MTMSRKRARASLQEDVLALIHRSRPAYLGQQHRLVDAYDAAWRAFCRCVAPQLSGHEVDDLDDDTSLTLARAMDQLRGISRRMCGSEHVLARRFMASIEAAPIYSTPPWASAFAPTTSSSSALSTSERVPAVLTYCTVQRPLLLIWAWVLHGMRVWRLEEVLFLMFLDGVSPDGEEDADDNEMEMKKDDGWARWICNPLHSMLSSLDRGVRWCDHSGALSLQVSSTRSLAEQIMLYLVRIAFNVHSTTLIPSDSSAGSTRFDQSSASVARRVLVCLCSPGLQTFSLTSFTLIARISKDLLAPVATTHKISNHDTNRSRRCALHRAFLRNQLESLLLADVKVFRSSSHLDDPGAHEKDTTNVMVIVKNYQLSASAADVVQLLLSVWDELTSLQQKAHEKRSVSSSSDQQFTRLFTAFEECADRDDAIVRCALRIAHDLVHEALSRSDPVLFRQGLDVVVAVNNGTSRSGARKEEANHEREDDVYSAWVYSHFSAPDPDSSRQPTTTLANTHAVQACQDFYSISGASRNNPALRPYCSLVTSKRHLQFVCAFLLESDRSSSLASSPRDRHRADHVYAHLRAIKTHQSMGNTGVSGSITGLLSDFCAQTRARHLELQKGERRVESAVAGDSGGSGAKQHSSEVGTNYQMAKVAIESTEVQYNRATRAIVSDLLATYGQERKLPPQVNHWKLFQPQQWKKQILPCCLDVGFWNERKDLIDDFPVKAGTETKRMNAWMMRLVGLVHTLAVQNALAGNEYERFLQDIERWLQAQRSRQVVRALTRQQTRHRGANVAALGRAMKNYIAVVDWSEMNSPPCDSPKWEAVVGTFIGAFEELTEIRGAEQEEQLRGIWESVVVQYGTVLASSRNPDSLTIFIEQHVSLWVRLLSSDTSEASPDDRMRAMDAYCGFSFQCTSKLIAPAVVSKAHQDEEVVSVSAAGCLLGLLGSLPMCGKLATTWLRRFEHELLLDSEVNSANEHKRTADIIKPIALFFCGFLAGLSQNSTTEQSVNAMILSILSSRSCACLVWLALHIRTWWGSSHSGAIATLTSPAVSDCNGSKMQWNRVWVQIERYVSKLASHDWFCMATAPDILQSCSQWEWWLMLEFESACGMLHIEGHPEPETDEQQLDNVRGGEDLLSYVTHESELLRYILHQAETGQVSGITNQVVCSTLIRTVISSAAASHSSSSASTLQAWVMVLKELCMVSNNVHNQLATRANILPCNTLRICIQAMAMTLGRNSVGDHSRQARVLRYGLACANALISPHQRQDEARQLVPQEILATLLQRVVHEVHHINDSFAPQWRKVLFTVAVLHVQGSSGDRGTLANVIPIEMLTLWAVDGPRIESQLFQHHHARGISQCSVVQDVRSCRHFLISMGILSNSPPNEVDPIPTTKTRIILQLRALHCLIEWGRVQLPSVVDGSLLTSHSIQGYHVLGSRVIRAILNTFPSEPGSLFHASDLLAVCCKEEWLGTVPNPVRTRKSLLPDFSYQFVLVYILSDLAARAPAVGRELLRTERDRRRNSNISLLLLLTLCISCEMKQLETMLNLNASLWVNGFCEIACTFYTSDCVNVQDPKVQTPDPSWDVLLFPVLQLLPRLQETLRSILHRVLLFAVSKKIDLLNSDVRRTLEHQFPELTATIKQVPVLCDDVTFTGNSSLSLP